MGIDGNEKYPLKEECYAVIGCAMYVHNELGPGFLEAVYQEAMEIELEENNIPFVREKPLNITFRNRVLRKKYYADFLCYDELIVELKACDSIIDDHIAQAINYLTDTKLKVALLLNFGSRRLQYKRVIV